MASNTLYYLFVDILLLTLQLLSAVGNGFIICLFLASKRLRQNQCLRLLLLLCFTDWVFVILTLPYTIYFIANWNEVSLHYDSQMVISLGAPITLHYKLNLIITNAIAIDRLQAMCKPTYYRMKNHMRFVWLTLLLGLAMGFIDVVLMFVFTELDNEIPNCAALLCFLNKRFRGYWGISNIILNSVLLILTICVAYELKHQRNKSQHSQMYNVKSQLKENGTGDKLSFAILLTSVIFLLMPSNIVGVTTLIQSKMFIYFGPFYFAGMLFAGVLNSIIYMTLHAEVRHAAKTLITKRTFKIDSGLTVVSTS
uniref:G_PROTEIN_RECEP_F1_2 domain-containing protein n=1 Tax=Panagrellus redivivus TaxID=6233 RepID=A0A7E4VJQ5_PANRE